MQSERLQVGYVPININTGLFLVGPLFQLHLTLPFNTSLWLHFSAECMAFE
jgi:hypothetical protein